jgi:prepilin-type N-terminal cleavage/methylation domain-containing protein
MKQYHRTIISTRRQAGLTLIELLIALALIAFLTFLIFGRGNEAQIRADVSSERDFVQSLLPSIRQQKTGASYAGVTATTLINSGTIDKSRISGTSLVNTVSSPLTIAAASFNGGTDNAFQLTNPGLPRATCVTVSQSLASISFVQQLTINGTLVKDTTANLEPTAATIGAGCTDQNNSVVIVGT